MWEIIHPEFVGRDRYEDLRDDAITDLREMLNRSQIGDVSVRIKPDGCYLFAPNPDMPVYSEPLKSKYIAVDICITPEAWKKLTLELFRMRPSVGPGTGQTASEAWESGYSQEHAESIAEELAIGGEVPMPFVVLNSRMELEGTQEGRHRGMAAKMVDVEWMNVRVLVDLSKP